MVWGWVYAWLCVVVAVLFVFVCLRASLPLYVGVFVSSPAPHFPVSVHVSLCTSPSRALFPFPPLPPPPPKADNKFLMPLLLQTSSSGEFDIHITDGKLAVSLPKWSVAVYQFGS